MKRNILVLLSIVTVLLLSLNIFAAELSKEQLEQILKKCQKQAAELAHQVDENAKNQVDYEIFDKAEIVSVTEGYFVKTKYKMHWDVEAYDPSSFTVEMSATLVGACELNKIIRN